MYSHVGIKTTIIGTMLKYFNKSPKENIINISNFCYIDNVLF